MFHPIFYGSVNNGKLILEKPDQFNQYLSRFNGEVQLTLTKRKKPRSESENAYYWGGVVEMIAEEMGLIKDEAHEYLKNLFLKVGVESKGRRFEITRPTSLLSTVEFEDFLEKCRQWAAQELGVSIPLPNEVEYEGKD